MSRRGDPVDVEIGRRVRAYRIARGLSQTGLGDRVGVTFQQIQKYEKGANRIGGSRLKRIAGVLRVPVSVLFGEDDKGEERAADRLLTEALAERYAARLLKAFGAVKGSGPRRALVEFVEAMAETEPVRGARRGLH